VRRQLGYVSQSGGTNPAAKVDDELVTLARLYGLTTADAAARATALRGVFDLEIVAAGTPGELKRRISGELVTFEVDDVAKATELLRGRGEARDIIHGSRRARRRGAGDQQAVPLMRVLDGAGIKVGALHIARPSLDDARLEGGST
jgi:ABC-2 type transport system ATP-binding protein